MAKLLNINVVARLCRVCVTCVQSSPAMPTFSRVANGH